MQNNNEQGLSNIYFKHLLQCYIEDLSCSTTGTLTLFSWSHSLCHFILLFSQLDWQLWPFLHKPYTTLAVMCAHYIQTLTDSWNMFALAGLNLPLSFLTPSSPNAVTAFKDILLPLKCAIIIERYFAVLDFLSGSFYPHMWLWSGVP